MRWLRAAAPLLLVLAACTGGGDPQPTGPSASASPSPAASGTVTGGGWAVTVTGSRAAFELPPRQADDGTLRPAIGQVFLVVEARFRNLRFEPGLEREFSSGDGILVAGGGAEYPPDGGGDEGFCLSCTLELSTSDEEFEFGFVYAIDIDQAAQSFGFRYLDAPPLSVSFGEIAPPSDEVEASGLELVAESPNGSAGLGQDFANSDLAFWGDLAVAGNYDGFRLLDVSDPASPDVLSEVRCRSRQGDVSIWEDLVFLSVDTPQTASGCESIDTVGREREGAFEGIRVFDVSNPAEPQLITAVATDCGSHTHTLVPDEDNGRVLLYVSSYAHNQDSLGDNCQNPFGRISVVEVPLDGPDAARVIAEPVLQDTPVHVWPELPDGPALLPTTGCHDIQVFVELRIAAAACLSEGQLWDISDPVRPSVTHHIDHPDVEFWHSAAFTWDGRYVVFGDETFFSEPGCRSERYGGLWFYEVADPSEPLAALRVPRLQGEAFPCSYHTFNVIPLADRYLLVASAYAAGTSVVDFTDPTSPREIAYLDVRSPVPSDTWSSYWYRNAIFASDMGERGLDVLRFQGDLGQEILRQAIDMNRMNPQTQEVALTAG